MQKDKCGVFYRTISSTLVYSRRVRTSEDRLKTDNKTTYVKSTTIKPHTSIINSPHRLILARNADLCGFNEHGRFCLQQWLNKKGNEVQHQKREIIPCCSPTQLAPIQLLYIDNNTITQKTLPNMVVEACGCM